MINLQSLKDWWTKYSFSIYVLVLVGLYMLYDRRGRQVAELKSTIEQSLLQQKLTNLASQASQEDAVYEKTQSDYATLKRVHGSLLAKYGISLDTEAPGSDPK